MYQVRGDVPDDYGRLSRSGGGGGTRDTGTPRHREVSWDLCVRPFHHRHRHLEKVGEGGGSEAGGCDTGGRGLGWGSIVCGMFWGVALGEDEGVGGLERGRRKSSLFATFIVARPSVYPLQWL